MCILNIKLNYAYDEEFTMVKSAITSSTHVM